MKSKIFTKIAKNIQVTILAIAIIVSSIQFSGVTEVKADDATFEASISGFPESYKPYLRQLHATYPNWTFQPFNTGIDFGTAVDNEASNDRSLTHTNYSEFLQSNASGDYNTATGKYIAKDGSTWVTASKNAVAYFMDPRNFLNDTYVFMFENLAYDAANQTQAGVEAILTGSFMANTNIAYLDANGTYIPTAESYSSKILQAAQTSGASAYYIASKILQEVGSGRNGIYAGMGASGSVSGNYSTSYKGIYNFYNIGASTSSQPILNGLKWASNAKNGYGTPWNTPGASIIGGAQYIAEKYINVGQNTTYLQKFNVTAKNTYKHQYMTNIFGCASETGTTAKAYDTLGIKSNQRHFIIPVYNNMPGDNTTVTMGKSGDKTGVITSNVNLRQGPSTGYSSLTKLSKDDVVTIKENVLTDRNYSVSWLSNPYWTKVDVVKNGVSYTGYVSTEYVTPEVENNLITGTTVSVKATTSNPNEKVIYRSDNPAVATVDDAGNITAVGDGTTTIRAFAVSGNFATYTIQVFTKGCVLDKTKATIGVGKKVKLNATVYPTDAPDKTVTWTSSNTSVAKVSKTGKVTGVGVGNATISATATAIGGAVGTCKIKVIRPVTGVKLNKTKKTLRVGNTYTLKATVIPEDATNKNVKWKSDNTAVAKVKKGVVTAVAPGTATITVTTNNGKKTATALITVISGQIGFKSVASYNQNTIKLTWNAATNVSGYIIYRRNSAGKYKKIAKLSASVTSYKDKKLVTGNTYSYKIRTYTVSGGKTHKSSFSAAASAKVVPKRVKFVSAMALQGNSAVVRWKRDKWVTGYQVYKKSNIQLKYRRVRTTKKNTVVKFTDGKAVSGYTYYYKVRSYKVVYGKKVYGKYSKVVSLSK